MSNVRFTITLDPFIFRWILTLLLCFVGFQSSAQFNNYKFQHITIDNGLSQNLVYCIAQDQQGFMWFGTKDGLNRYDGYDFTAYHHNPFDTTSLSDNTITSLFTDSKDRLWIGTFHGGLNLFDRSANSFNHHLINKGLENQTGGENISAITEDAAGNLWVGTYGNGLFKIEFDGNSTVPPTGITHYHHFA